MTGIFAQTRSRFITEPWCRQGSQDAEATSYVTQSQSNGVRCNHLNTHFWFPICGYQWVLPDIIRGRDFDSAAEEEITPQIEISSGDAIDTDGDGLPDVLEESQYGTLKDDPDTDNDGMSDGWEVAHGLNPLDSGEAEEAEEESGSTNQADGADVSNESDSLA